VASAAKGFGIHVHACVHSLNSLQRYDSIPGIQPARNDPSVIDPVAHSDGSNAQLCYGVYNDGDLISRLAVPTPRAAEQAAHLG
jgi:hypothetical protein